MPFRFPRPMRMLLRREAIFEDRVARLALWQRAAFAHRITGPHVPQQQSHIPRGQRLSIETKTLYYLLLLTLGNDVINRCMFAATAASTMSSMISATGGESSSSLIP